MMLEQANRQIARAAAREARRRELEALTGVDVTTPANDNNKTVVLARPSTILPPPSEESAVLSETPAVAVAVETAVATTVETAIKASKNGITCGIVLPAAAHALLKKRAEANKTSLKIEVLRAVLRDL